MREIVWLWTATVAWLFVIPRVSEYAGGGLASEASAFAAVAAIIVVAVPWLRRLEIRWTLVLLLLLFAADRILIG